MTNLQQMAASIDLDPLITELRASVDKTIGLAERGQLWWQCPHNLQRLLDHLFESCDSMEEQRRVMNEVLDKPWKWTDEFEKAKREASA